MCVDCEDHFIMTSLLFLHCCSLLFSYKTILFFFFNDTATTEIYTLSLHDALPISGFVDTHWHLWTSLLRPYVRADVNELGYFPVSNRLGQLYTPEDSYRSVMLGIAEALSAGVTTVHNWAHNVRSPDHADAELSAMRDTGIRGRFAYGTPQGHADDQPMDHAGLARAKRDWMPGDGLLTLGICSRNVGAMSIGGATRGVL